MDAEAGNESCNASSSGSRRRQVEREGNVRVERLVEASKIAPRAIGAHFSGNPVEGQESGLPLFPVSDLGFD